MPGMIDGLAARFAEVAERLVAPPGRDIVFVRRELDDPEDRAPRRRRKGDWAETRILHALVVGGRRERLPKVGDAEIVGANRLHVRRIGIDQDG
jgi:hypothetical protein